MVSRYIPEDVKWAVRRRCGFGCIFCGLPFFEYDHLVDFSICQEHDATNINLLCRYHHGLKSTKTLSQDAVAHQAKKPVNLETKLTSGMKLELVGPTIVFSVGRMRFEQELSTSGDSFSAIRISGQDVLGLSQEDGWLQFDMMLVDQAGDPLIVAKKGELSFTTEAYDYNKVGNQFTLLPNLGEAAITMVVNGSDILLNQGLFMHRGRYVRATEDGAELGRFVTGPLAAPAFLPNQMIGNLVSRNDGAGIVMT